MFNEDRESRHDLPMVSQSGHYLGACDQLLTTLGLTYT